MTFRQHIDRILAEFRERDDAPRRAAADRLHAFESECAPLVSALRTVERQTNNGHDPQEYVATTTLEQASHIGLHWKSGGCHLGLNWSHGNDTLWFVGVRSFLNHRALKLIGYRSSCGPDGDNTCAPAIARTPMNIQFATEIILDHLGREKGNRL